MFLRQAESGPEILVALNFFPQSIRLNLPELGRGRLVISTGLDREEPVDLGSLAIREDEGVIVELIRGEDDPEGS
jgi:hypothetical protein